MRGPRNLFLEHWSGGGNCDSNLKMNVQSMVHNFKANGKN